MNGGATGRTLTWLEGDRRVGLRLTADGPGPRWEGFPPGDLGINCPVPSEVEAESLLTVPLSKGLWVLDLVGVELGDPVLLIGALPIARICLLATTLAGAHPRQWVRRFDPDEGLEIAAEAVRAASRPSTFIVADHHPETLQAVLAILDRGDTVLVANASPGPTDFVPYRDLLVTRARVIALPPRLSAWPGESSDAWLSRAARATRRISPELLSDVVFEANTSGEAGQALTRGFLVAEART